MAAVPRCSWSEGRLLYVTGSCCWPSRRTVRASCNGQPTAGGRRGQRGVRLPDRRRRHSPACCASSRGAVSASPGACPPAVVARWSAAQCAPRYGVRERGAAVGYAPQIRTRAPRERRAPRAEWRAAWRTSAAANQQARHPAAPGAHPRGSICQAAARVAPSRESARASKCTVRFRFRRRASHCSEMRGHKLFCENVRSGARCRCAATKHAPGWLHAADARVIAVPVPSIHASAPTCARPHRAKPPPARSMLPRADARRALAAGQRAPVRADAPARHTLPELQTPTSLMAPASRRSPASRDLAQALRKACALA